MMDTFDKIKAKVAKHADLLCTVEDSTLSIRPLDRNGFTVWITDNNPGFTVGFDGWHEEFEDETDALNCLALGLSDQCRLKVIKRGDTDVAWIVESRDGNHWKEDWTTGLVFVPFWKKKSIEYRQNTTIKMSALSSAYDP